MNDVEIFELQYPDGKTEILKIILNGTELSTNNCALYNLWIGKRITRHIHKISSIESTDCIVKSVNKMEDENGNTVRKIEYDSIY